MGEIRLALRRLRYRPAATLASILTLGCAIGAAASAWALLSATLLHPLPVADPDRLVVAGTRQTSGRFAGQLLEGLLYPEFARLRETGAFAEVAAEWGIAPSLRTTAGGPPAMATVGFATANYFDLLGVRVRTGRGFVAAEDRRGATPVAVLTDAYCRREFDACNNALGRVLTVGDKKILVIGVIEPPFHGTDLSRAIDFYLPFHTIADVAPPWMNYLADPGSAISPTAGTKIIARLRDGDRRHQLGDIELTPIEAAAVPSVARAGMVQFARLLAITVGLLLLLGCGTVGMLVLVRTEARRDEFALCVALGASRLRLAGGIAAESALLAAAGAALAIPLTWWLFSAAAAFQLPGGIPVARLELHLDPRTVAGIAAGALAASAIVPLVAGAMALAVDAAEAMRSRAGATPRVRRRATRSTLVAGQVAISLVLAGGAGLFVRSLSAALHLNSGLDVDRVISDSVYLDSYGYTPVQAPTFFDAVRDRLTGDPSITSMAYAIGQGGMVGTLTIDGEPRQFPTQVRFLAVEPQYFQTVGIRLLGGRDFTADDRSTSPRVAIVSESFARHLALGDAAIGRRMTMPFYRPPQPPAAVQVVGIVSDVVSHVSELEPLDMYFPITQADASAGRTLVARAAADVSAARRAVGAAIRTTDPRVITPLFPTLAEVIGQQMSVQAFGAAVLGSLGTIALILTALGSYVLAESSSVLRRREMGIRAALGATRTQLSVIVFGETLRLIGAGVLAGLLLAWMEAATIRSFLFQVQPLDAWTLGGVSALILLLTALTSLRPAVRAAHVDLAQVLKEQ